MVGYLIIFLLQIFQCVIERIFKIGRYFIWRSYGRKFGDMFFDSQSWVVLVLLICCGILLHIFTFCPVIFCHSLLSKHVHIVKCSSVHCALLSDSQLPKSWDPMTTSESFKQVALNPTSAEYRDVEQKIRSTANNTVNQIISVNTSYSTL